MRTEETHLSQLAEMKNDLHIQISMTSESSTTISNMLLMQSYMDHLDQQISKKNEEIQIAQHVVVKKQEHFSERMIHEKVWTKAKEKAYAQFMVVSGRKEQETLDEISNQSI